MNSWLVRGVGRRAIKVIVRPLYKSNEISTEDAAILAAEYANKKGWRVVFAAPDCMEGTTLRAFNSHQYFHEDMQRGFPGKFLCCLG